MNAVLGAHEDERLRKVRYQGKTCEDPPDSGIKTLR